MSIFFQGHWFMNFYLYFEYLLWSNNFSNTLLELPLLAVNSIFDFDMNYFQMLALYSTQSFSTIGHIENKCV